MSVVEFQMDQPTMTAFTTGDTNYIADIFKAPPLTGYEPPGTIIQVEVGHIRDYGEYQMRMPQWANKLPGWNLTGNYQQKPMNNICTIDYVKSGYPPMQQPQQNPYPQQMPCGGPPIGFRPNGPPGQQPPNINHYTQPGFDMMQIQSGGGNTNTQMSYHGGG